MDGCIYGLVYVSTMIHYMKTILCWFSFLHEQTINHTKAVYQGILSYYRLFSRVRLTFQILMVLEETNDLLKTRERETY